VKLFLSEPLVGYNKFGVGFNFGHLRI